VDMGAVMNKKRQGFTLTEIIIVVAIIGVLTLSIVDMSITAYRKSQISALSKMQDLIVEQLKRYYDINGTLPSSQSAFESFLADERYFTQVPVMPLYTGSTGSGWTWVYQNSYTGVLTPSDTSLATYTRTVDMSKFTRTTPYNRASTTYRGDG